MSIIRKNRKPEPCNRERWSLIVRLKPEHEEPLRRAAQARAMGIGVLVEEWTLEKLKQELYAERVSA